MNSSEIFICETGQEGTAFLMRYLLVRSENVRGRKIVVIGERFFRERVREEVKIYFRKDTDDYGETVYLPLSGFLVVRE